MEASPVVAEIVCDTKCILGEGPVWDPRSQSLLFVDIKGATLFQYFPDSGALESHRLDTAVCALAPRLAGGFVAALADRLAIIDASGRILQELARPELDRPGNRFNDGKLDPDGRFWFGSMDDAERHEAGALYCLDADGQISRHDDGYIVTNGPTFSPDGSVLYHTDSYKRTIYAFDRAQDGQLANKRVFYEVPPDLGYPDGMTTDAEGCVWVCHFDGSRITRLSPSGDPLSEVLVPVRSVTSCCFGGPDMATLYITTASLSLSEDSGAAHPHAGGLFACVPGVRGLAPRMYGG